MILVTVGMHTQPFDRLVRAADELACLAQDDMVIQRGCASYLPRHSRHVDYVTEDQMLQWASEARVVIAHGGAGVILNTSRPAPKIRRRPPASHRGRVGLCCEH